MDDFISLKVAAERSGYHPNHIRRLLRARSIRGYRQGRDWRVDSRSLDRWSKGGGPPHGMFHGSTRERLKRQARAD